MNKLFWYVLIFAAIATYFYVGYSVSSHWEAAVKYNSKVTQDTLGKEIPILNLKDTRQGDFYVTIDSVQNRKYFRVMGLTSDSLLCVNYGKDVSVLPQILDYSSYIVSPGLFIDKRVSWVDEVIKNEENFNDKLDFLSRKEIDSLLNTQEVIGFGLNDDNYTPEYNFMFKYTVSHPSILGFVILIILVLIFIFEKILSIIPTKKKQLVRYLVVLSASLVYAIFNVNYVGLSQLYINNTNIWQGYILIFISHSLVFFTFQFVSEKIRQKDFEVREFIKFITIIFSGIIFQLIFKLISIFILDKFTNYDKELSNIFFLTLQQAFKFWIAIATANFFHNLIRYIYTLRRKSKQLQTVTSDAQLSADALQQSEAHVNTHFLYNSLHAIAALAPVAPDKTETLALSLAKYYRYTTNRNDKTWITIKDEVEALTAYLEVEKIRMGEKLSYDFDIKDNVLSVKIPKFLLQPFLENAVKYGYNAGNDTTEINIFVIKNDDDTLKISVCDRGKAFSEAMEIGKSIRNVKDMLKRFYPDGHMISFVNEPLKCVEIILGIKNLTK
jgi:two-component system, LytTR family, sensor kinase